jgi:hypothetical protein
MYEELRDKLDYDLFYLKRGNNSFRHEPTIYHTRDEHANLYITNTVDLYLTNMLRWIPIVLPYWNISPQVRHVAPHGHIIPIPSQPAMLHA